MRFKLLFSLAILLAGFTYLATHYALPLVLPDLPLFASWIDVFIAVELGIPVVMEIYSNFLSGLA